MFLQLDGDKRIHYTKTGNGDSLILLHGNGEDLTIFDEAVAILKDHFTVYALDMAGHGKSYCPKRFHYVDNAEDVVSFIKKLGIEKPYLYGFSDGGIVGIMVAFMEPQLLSKLAVSGVNINPHGLKPLIYLDTKFAYIRKKKERYRLMLEEPDITDEDLSKISVPAFLMAGQHDCIKGSHTKYIAEHIKGSKLSILPKESHESYVVHSEKIAHYLMADFLDKRP